MIDGGRAAILELTRQFNADGSVTKRPFDHVTAAGDGAGFHHMHRLDLLMCLYKRVFEFGPDSGAPCPITVHMDCRLTQLRKDTAAQKALLETLDERVSPAFAHDKRGGERRLVDLCVRRTQYRRRIASQEIGTVGLSPSREGRLRHDYRQALEPAAPASGTRPVTREEVAQHNNRDDCWLIVSEKVYDITEWAPHHPGGAGIARMYAGKEATAEFGDYHSAEAVAHMAHFCIGELVETQPPCRDRSR